MGFEPRIVGFLCNWCSYTGADLAGTSRIQYQPNLRVIRVMCSARVDPTFILQALVHGADGVLICGCHPGDCHYMEGNYKALRRFRMLKRLLCDLGIEEARVRLEWVSASEGKRFAEIVDDMTEKVRELGPCTLRERLQRRTPAEAAEALMQEVAGEGAASGTGGTPAEAPAGPSSSTPTAGR